MKAEQKRATKVQKEVSVNYLLQINDIYEASKWRHILDFAMDNQDVLLPNDLRLIEDGNKYPAKVPQEFQAKKIMQAVERLRKVGLEC